MSTELTTRATARHRDARDNAHRQEGDIAVQRWRMFPQEGIEQQKNAVIHTKTDERRGDEAKKPAENDAVDTPAVPHGVKMTAFVVVFVHGLDGQRPDWNLVD